MMSFVPVLVQRLQARLSLLPERDAFVLKVLGFFLLALALYFLAWKPSSDYRSTAAMRLERSAELRTWMLDNEQRARPDVNGGTTQESSSSLLALIDATARTQNLRFQRYEPNAAGGVRIWFEDVPFNGTIAWLAELAGNGILTTQISVERKGATGLVDITLELE